MLENFLKLLCLIAIRAAKQLKNYSKNDKKTLKILLVGYNGASSFGADIRVSELIKQIYSISSSGLESESEKKIHLGVLTLSKKQSSEVYQVMPDELISISSFFIWDLFKMSLKYDIAILCEGNCFLTNYTNILPIFMATAAGLFKSQKKKCFAYGIDAGFMIDEIKNYVIENITDTKIITRSEGSSKEIKKLGFEKNLLFTGVDTAWTYEIIFSGLSKIKTFSPQNNLIKFDKILAISVTNPYAWPIYPSLLNLILYPFSKKIRQNHYNKFYFHSFSRQRENDFLQYKNAISSLAHYAKTVGFKPILLGLETFDNRTCREISELAGGIEFYDTSTINPHKIAGIIKSSDIMFSSDYHGKIIAMLAGVPCAGIAKDERLPFLFDEIKYGFELVTDARSENLEKNIKVLLETLINNIDIIREKDDIYRLKAEQKINKMNAIFMEAIYD